MNLFFIAQKKLLSENMNHFNQLPEFEKEFLRLSQKYRSLPEDLEKLKRLIESRPTGSGKNFTIIHSGPEIKIIKNRLTCKSLRNRSIRLIYAYHEKILTFIYIEIYFKGDKANEDRTRIKDYLENRIKIV